MNSSHRRSFLVAGGSSGLGAACVRRLADATRRHHGEFVLNWHNTSLSAAAAGYDRSLYVRTLEYLAR